jgi:hypothetical protein
VLLGVIGKERDRSLFMFTLLDLISRLVEGPWIHNWLKVAQCVGRG